MLTRAASYDVGMKASAFGLSDMVSGGSGGSGGGAGGNDGFGAGRGPTLTRASSAPAVMMHRKQFFDVLNALEVNVENRVNANTTINDALRQQFRKSSLKTIREAAASEDARSQAGDDVGGDGGLTSDDDDESTTAASSGMGASGSTGLPKVAQSATGSATANAQPGTSETAALPEVADAGHENAPAAKPTMPDVVLFTEAEVREVIETVRAGKPIPGRTAHDILERAVKLFDAEQTVVYIDGPSPLRQPEQTVCLREIAWCGDADSVVLITWKDWLQLKGLFTSFCIGYACARTVRNCSRRP